MTTNPIPIREHFNVEDVIRDLLKPGEAVDTHVLAAQTLAQIPRRHRDAVLAELLSDKVRVFLSGQRRAALSPAAAAAVAEAPTSARGSARWQSASKSLAAEAAKLRAMPVGGTQSVPLASCSRSDLLDLIAMHEAHARGNARRAAQYTRLLAALDESGAQTAGEVPDEALVAAFAD